jgi:hypothetical protein
MSNWTAFNNVENVLFRMKAKIDSHARRMGSNNKAVISWRKDLEEMFLALEQMPVLADHIIWSKLEKGIRIQRCKNPNLGLVIVKFHVSINGTDEITFDLTKKCKHENQN